MGPKAGLDGCGNTRPPTGIRSPDRTASSESLPTKLSRPTSYRRVQVKSHAFTLPGRIASGSRNPVPEIFALLRFYAA